MASIEPVRFRRVRTAQPDGRSVTVKVELPRKDWRWRVRYRDADGRSREQTFARKFDAERFVETNGADLVRGEWIDPRQRRVTFEHWATEWWATTVKLRPSTRRGYRIMLDGHVLPWFGARSQSAIDFLDVERFIAAKLTEGLGRKKVRDLVSIVSCVMRLVVLSGARKDNPAARHDLQVRRPKLKPGDVPDMAEVLRLVECTRAPYRPAVWLLVLVGLRPSELCGLRVRSVDFARRTIAVTETLTPVHGFDNLPYGLVEGPPMTDAGDRVLPIPAWLAEDLAAMLAARAARRGRPTVSRDEWLFESIKGDRPLNRDAFRKYVVRPALRAAGLSEDIRTYDLRHSHASLLIDLGANVLDVAHRMGHSDPSVTLGSTDTSSRAARSSSRSASTTSVGPVRQRPTRKSFDLERPTGT
jgi:integrase